MVPKYAKDRDRIVPKYAFFKLLTVQKYAFRLKAKGKSCYDGREGQDMVRRKAYDELVSWKNTKTKECLFIKEIYKLMSATIPGIRFVKDKKVSLPHFMALFL